MPIQLTHREGHRYIDTALQYYILGRYGVVHRLTPVAPNVFHHAIEMMLKVGLLNKHSERVLSKKPYSHNLENLWAEFKTLLQDPALDQYDDVIAELNKWEDIRYPTYPRGLSLGMSMGLFKADAVLTDNNIDLYTLTLEAIDELFSVLVHALSIHPPYIRDRLRLYRTLQIYKRHNRHPLW